MIMNEYASSTNLPRTSALAMILVLVMVVMLVAGLQGAAEARQGRRLRWRCVKPRAAMPPTGGCGAWGGPLHGVGYLFLVLPIATMIVFSFQLISSPRPGRGLDPAMVRQAVRRRHAAAGFELQPHRLAAGRDRRLRPGLPRRLCDPPLPLSRPRCRVLLVLPVLIPP